MADFARIREAQISWLMSFRCLKEFVMAVELARNSLGLDAFTSYDRGL